MAAIMIRILLLLLLLSLAYPAHSLEPYTCQNGAFPSFDGEISSAVITADSGSRVHFRDDAKGCPDAETCIQRAYLINGYRVLLSHRESRWACAWYFGKKMEFVGWLTVERDAPPASRLRAPHLNVRRDSN